MPETAKNTVQVPETSKKSEVNDKVIKPTESAKDQAEKRPRTSLQQKIFSISVVLSCFVVLPYAYYAMEINKFAHANKADDVLFPEYSGLLTTLAATIGFNIYRNMLHLYLTPIVLIFLVPEKDEEGEILSTE